MPLQPSTRDPDGPPGGRLKRYFELPRIRTGTIDAYSEAVLTIAEK